MMAFTRNDGSIALEQQFGAVRQLYQMGQATRTLLAGDLTPLADKPLLHPVLGEEKGFKAAPLVPQIRESFRPDSLP